VNLLGGSNMVDVENEIENWAEEYAAKLDISDKAVQEWERDFEKNWGQELENQKEDIDTILEDIEEAANKLRGSKGVSDVEKRRIFTNTVNNVLKLIGYGPRKNLSINDLGSNLNLKKVGFKPNINEAIWDEILNGTSQAPKPENQHPGLIGSIEMARGVNPEWVKPLEKILKKLSKKMSDDDTGKDVTRIASTTKELLRDLGEADITLAEDRKDIYSYWGKIYDEYESLKKAIRGLKRGIKNREIPDEIKDAIKNLKEPPNYVIEVDYAKITLDTTQERVVKFLETLGGKRPKLGQPTPMERERHGFGRGGEPYRSTKQQYGSTELMQTRELTGREAELLSEESLEWKEELTDGMVDPILWYVIQEEMLDMPAALDEELILEARLENIIKHLGKDSPEGKAANERLERLSETAATHIDDMYLPATDWLNKTEEINIDTNINTKTGEFFNQLGEIFIKGSTMPSPRSKSLKDKDREGSRVGDETGYPLPAKFPISMETDVGSPKRGTAGGMPETKPDWEHKPRLRGMRQRRAQQYEPAKKREYEDDKFNKSLNKLVTALNDYYFKPLGRGVFIDGDKPRFIEEHKGEFPYRLIRFNVGKTPDIELERDLLSGVTTAVDITILEELENYLKGSKTGLITEGIKNYVDNVEEAVDLLNKLFPTQENENMIWGAGKIGRAIELHNSDANLKEIEYNGRPLLPVYNKYLKMDRKQDWPLEYLRTFLAGDTLQNVLRSKVKFYDKAEGEKLQPLIDSILDLTDPAKINEPSPVGKAILKIHDAIRKMENKPIIHGTMYLDDINTMDYIINKMESEFKVDINAFEISKIVKSIDSFENLSKNYGVSEEVVYTIKGLCR
jgi:transcription initiation factor IIE alpha subunit